MIEIPKDLEGKIPHWWVIMKDDKSTDVRMICPSCRGIISLSEYCIDLDGKIINTYGQTNNVKCPHCNFSDEIKLIGYFGFKGLS